MWEKELEDAIKEGKTVLLEGQLGPLKDPDHGIYPMVTSSSTLAAFGAIGAGIPPYEIKDIITAPGFDKDKALKQQIEILTMKRDHFNDLIGFAKAMKTKGVSKMDFEVFDTKKIDEYSKKAKAQWGGTSAYKEFEEKNKGRSIDDCIFIRNCTSSF